VWLVLRWNDDFDRFSEIFSMKGVYVMDFVEINQFPEYCVNSEGIIVNSMTGREMVLSPTENGDLTVGLMRDGIQFRRSVKGIVARTFVPGETEIFDTPILLDGNKENLNVENIEWRPRWFSWKYSRQFLEPLPEWYHDGPIIDITSDRLYDTILEAAMIHGLLCNDVYESISQGNRVFPTGQIFRFYRIKYTYT
jgi:hypothetical protein